MDIGDIDNDDEDDDNDEEMQEAAEGAGACGGSSNQQQVDGSNSKYRASLMRRCMDPDASAFTTTTAVQTAIDGVQKLMQQGHVDISDGLARLNDLNKRKEELLLTEVRARRERTREERKAEEEDNKSDAASSNTRDYKRR